MSLIMLSENHNQFRLYGFSSLTLAGLTISDSPNPTDNSLEGKVTANGDFNIENVRTFATALCVDTSQ